MTNEQLLNLFLAAASLKSLHSKQGGLEQHRNQAEVKLEEYRQEILRRMNHGKEVNQAQD